MGFDGELKIWCKVQKSRGQGVRLDVNEELNLF